MNTFFSFVTMSAILVKDNDFSNEFASTRAFSKYSNQIIDSETTLNFLQGISSFESGNYVAELTGSQGYGDWLSTDFVKLKIQLYNFDSDLVLSLIHI